MEKFSAQYLNFKYLHKIISVSVLWEMVNCENFNIIQAKHLFIWFT